ncbi:adenylate/guanylate cyclase domain-containing protein [Acidimangrovimonas sediminis]|uniref:adenylate/guanylate cyclase domain-containing protein n=1 Tax=Acidimangrovimonas sediminis TaxID=2056283 RepID=UPI000C800ADA|nr:adenylate/guanylate cyclase domain-containing protein [Acidimangrovimonas sediminis]
MAKSGTELSLVLIDKVEEWLEQAALDGEDLKTIINGTCERLAALGVPIDRVYLSFSMLHPLYDALGFSWRRGEGLSVEGLTLPRNEEKPERFLKSPFYFLLQNKLDHLRRRIEPDTPSEFPIFDDLKAMGATDYLCFVQSFGDGQGRGMMGSWSTTRDGGFEEQAIEALLYIQRKLAVTAKMALLTKLAGNMMETYVGASAGERVLSGQTRRGDVETIRAVLVMADMRGSTMMAETLGRDDYTETLNQFFDAIAEPFNRDGGEILSFIGDGFLAVFPTERHAKPTEIAARRATDAAREALQRVAALNQERAGQGLEPIGFGIGLHIGNVIFGNVGLARRLTFSAFGASVNEAQRLEALTKTLGSPIVASEAFVDYAGGAWKGHGERELAGLSEKIAVFTPVFEDAAERQGAGEAAPVPAAGLESHSEAEQIMMLFRDKTPPSAIRGGRSERRAS